MISQLICEKALYSILSFVEIKCIFMVRKIGQLLLNAYGGVGGPNTFPLSKHVRSNLKIFFTDSSPKDVPTNTKLVWNNSSPHREEKPIWCGGGPPSVGHQRVKICQLSDLVNFDFVHFSNQLKFTQKNVHLLNC